MVSTYPPKRGAAFTAVFPILDADGDLVTGAAGLDSEISKDLGIFADCTNEATELATSSGMYYLTLTATEMTADIVAIIVKTSTSGAKTTSLVFYTAAQTDDELDDKVDSIVAKLPTNYIMGSSVLTAKDDEIDDIKTEVLTHPTLAEMEASAVLAMEATLTAMKGAGFATGTDSLKILSDVLDLINAKTTNLPSDPADASEIKSATDTIAGYVDTEVAAIKAVTDTLSLSAIADAVHDEVMEGTLTLRQAIRIFVAALGGKSAGGGTATLTFRDVADAKNRISATVDASGNRTAITLDGS